jgi:hypothetical protein
MNTLKRYWPIIAHAAFLVLVYGLPALKAFAATHPAYDGLYVALSGFLLHQATSPSDASRF